MKRKNKTLEELCPFASKCIVDCDKSEICWGAYTYCKIYKELIKFKKEYLKMKSEGKIVLILKMCPFTGSCSESNYGSEDICGNDYETCNLYRLFKKEKN